MYMITLFNIYRKIQFNNSLITSKKIIKNKEIDKPKIKDSKRTQNL